MSSRNMKLPSSARRHIKIETFSQFVSATRLRQVQSILHSSKVGSPDIDGILCIAGIDSHYNKGMYDLLNYLLFGFFDVRKVELERSGFADEVIDDLMLLVGPDHVEVYCNPIIYHYLLPYISHWPGLKFHCLTENEYEAEDDAVEEFKIRSFIAMVSNCKVVGLPFSGRGHKMEFDVMALEKWPIIQAFALDCFNGGGFFTLTHEVVDVSDEVHYLSNYMDPVSVEILLTEHYPLMVRHWDNMMKCVQIALESSSPVIDNKKVSETYIMGGHLVENGFSICEMWGTHVGILPFVAFGPDSDKATLQKVVNGEKGELSDLPLKTDSRASHMICQVVSPHNPLVCARTYFFCSRPYSINAACLLHVRLPDHHWSDKVSLLMFWCYIMQYLTPAGASVSQVWIIADCGVSSLRQTHFEFRGGSGISLQHSQENTELRYLVGVYLSMVKAVLSAIEMFAHTSSITKARVKCMETLQESCSKLDSLNLMDYLSQNSSVDFHIDTLTCSDKKIPLIDGETNSLMKYISLALYEIPVPEFLDSSRCPRSMMFTETFLDSRISSAGCCDISSDYLILTSSIPRHRMWSLSGHAKKQNMEVLNLPVEQWGEQLLKQADIYMMGTWTALTPPEKITLTFWRHGLSVQSYDYGSFGLHGSDISRLLLFDGNSISQMAMLIVEIKLTDVLIDCLPPHLYAECNDSGIGHIVFAFTSHSKSYSQFYGNVLPSWKSGSQFPSVERLELLDSQLQFLHTYLQNKVNLLTLNTIPTTGLKRVALEMPELCGFLEHLNKSCGLHGPVMHGVFQSLTGTSDSHEGNSDDKIIVTIITGIPGSCKETLATSLTTYNKNITNWLIYKQSEECQMDTAFFHHFMSSAAQSRDQWLLTKSTRLIVIAPGFCDTSEVVRAICFHPDHKLRSEFITGSITMCIDPENTFLEHKMTFPMLGGNCAQGWVNNILFTSQTQAPNDLLDNIQTLIRSINTDVALLKAENGLVKRSSDLDLIMSKSAFSDPNMEKARVLLKPFWREGYPHAWPCNPQMKDVVLRFTHPLEKHLTLLKLRAIRSSLKGHPYEGNVYFVRGYLTFTGSPTTFMDIHFTTLNGKLVMNETKIVKSSGEGTANFMCFTGVGLKDHELKKFLSTCLKQKPEKKPLLSRQDLTSEEIDKIHKIHHLDELPEGWYYNGSHFVSMEGERSLRHPNLEHFIQAHLDKKNADIEKYNARIESEIYVSLWQN